MLSLIAAIAMAPSSPPVHAHAHDECELGFYTPAFAVDAILDAQEQQEKSQEKPAEQPALTKEQQEEKKHQEQLENDKKIGREASVEIDKQLKPSEDQEATARLKAIGAEIAEIANAEVVSVMWGDPRHNVFDYEFKLVKGDDVNAFSLPGGVIYFYEGLLDFAESDDELAGVVAHEISHASFRHMDALRREQSKIDLIQIPLLIAAAMGSGGNQDAMKGLIAVQLIGAGLSSGWSVKAETSADYGGLQYLRKSRYNPVGMLTFMERLGYRERLSPQIDWGIYQTHPPTTERAKFIIRSLNEYGIALKRSQTTTSLSGRSVPMPDGSFTMWFGDYEIATYRGEGAKERAARSIVRMNTFLDTVPQMFQLSTNGNEILGNGRTLIEFQQSDLKPDQTMAQEREDTLVAFRRVISELNMRLWRS